MVARKSAGRAAPVEETTASVLIVAFVTADWPAIVGLPKAGLLRLGLLSAKAAPTVRTKTRARIKLINFLLIMNQLLSARANMYRYARRESP